MDSCPNCGFARREEDAECPNCGVIYEKYLSAVESKGKKTLTTDESQAPILSIIRGGLKSFLIFLYFFLFITLFISLIYQSSILAVIPAVFILSGIIFRAKYKERKREKWLLQKREEEMAKQEKERSQERSQMMANWGFKKASKEFEVFEYLLSFLERQSFLKKFHSFNMHNLHDRRALELRSGYPDSGGIESLDFKNDVVNEIKKIKKHLSEIEHSLICDDFKELNQVGEDSFPSVFLFTHQCKFLTKYGEEVSGIDAMVAILFEDIMKIQPAFNKDILHRIARIEFCDTGVEIETLTYEELITPGIVKVGGKRSQIPQELREQLLAEADYACQECGARAVDGATLEIDHIIPIAKGGSDEYLNLQVLCATCNRKKGARS